MQASHSVYISDIPQWALCLIHHASLLPREFTAKIITAGTSLGVAYTQAKGTTLLIEELSPYQEHEIAASAVVAKQVTVQQRQGTQTIIAGEHNVDFLQFQWSKNAWRTKSHDFAGRMCSCGSLGRVERIEWFHLVQVIRAVWAPEYIRKADITLSGRERGWLECHSCTVVLLTCPLDPLGSCSSLGVCVRNLSTTSCSAGKNALD